jgi:parallel beta-helix repeat protein/predicted outer membrane repeat protein
MGNISSSPTVEGCIFTDNSAYESGGGMGNHESSNPTVTNCTFTNNSAYNDSGGGMYNETDCSPIVTNCTFSGNSANEYGGGMENTYSSNPIVTNCTFSSNQAWYGGGMDNYESSPTVTNCSFSGNQAWYGGGGMYNYEGSPAVTNCILWGNFPDPVYDDYYSYSIVRYCDIQGGWEEETGNIDTDPLFAGSGDLRLQAGSPCIDTGDNSAVPTGVTTDLAGNPRIQDADCDGQTIVDMGAFEFYLVGDLSKNCLVDLSDIDLFTDNWLETGCAAINNWCDGADIDKNGNIDLSDFADIANHWLECTSPECG